MPLSQKHCGAICKYKNNYTASQLDIHLVSLSLSLCPEGLHVRTQMSANVAVDNVFPEFVQSAPPPQVKCQGGKKEAGCAHVRTQKEIWGKIRGERLAA